MDNVLGESVRRLRRSSRRGRRLACVAVDGSGLAQHAVSTYFIRRIEQHAGEKTRYNSGAEPRIMATARNGQLRIIDARRYNEIVASHERP